VRIGVIDVGSNSVRLLVAAVSKTGSVKQLQRERTYVRLGDDAYALGRIGERKLATAETVAREYATIARKRRVERLETIVTAPGRQAANSDELLHVLAEATDAPVVLLSADDEGRLAWEGAVARLEDASGRLAVVDLGGGSCELAVGTTATGPDWVQSVDAGALRVTRALLGGDPPAAEVIASARQEIQRLLAPFDAPRPDRAIAVGGTARAIGRIVGRRYDLDLLDELARTLAVTRAADVVREHGITAERAETLLGGTLVLAEVARRLGAALEVGRGGLREGAALALARVEAAA
jgi:exopolyphosphatase / guanosine-5'-triphosphate,3'-diphosphate pyrophosphatase